MAIRQRFPNDPLPWVFDWREAGARRVKRFPTKLDAERFRGLVDQRKAARGEAPAVDPRSTVHAYGRHWLDDVLPGKDLRARTIETYRLRLMRKLGFEDLPSLVKYAIRHGITSLE